MYIYRITNNLNGKAYIGQTVQPVEKRWSEHCRKSRPGIGAAIKKYGKENFTFEVLAEAFDLNELDWLERKFIEKFNTMAPNGYNLCDGGRVMRHTEESKYKLSKAHTGKTLSEEHKKRLAESHKGKKLTEEHRNKLGIPVICIETGIEYPTAVACAKHMGLIPTAITAVLKGRRKTHGGYTFAYKEELQ